MGSRNFWCKHYRAISENKTCKAGVPYESIVAFPVDTCPCWKQQETSICDRAEYRTADEVEARNRWLEERFQNIATVRQAIVQYLGGPWKRGDPSSAGIIHCPLCEGSITFSRSGYNGHIHAFCSRDGCVRWIE